MVARVRYTHQQKFDRRSKKIIGPIAVPLCSQNKCMQCMHNTMHAMQSICARVANRGSFCTSIHDSTVIRLEALAKGSKFEILPPIPVVGVHAPEYVA
jgi:hypothetical protein